MKLPLGPQEGLAQEQLWEPCSPGTLQEAASVSLNRRLNLLKMIAGGTVLTVVGVTALCIQANQPPNSSKGSSSAFLSGVECNSVIDQMPTYLNGKLDESSTEAMTCHLINCAQCRRQYTQLCCNSHPNCVSRPSKPKFKATPCALR